DEGLCEGVETLGGSEPAELVGEIPYSGAERVAVRAPHERVDPVGGDDQVVALQFVFRTECFREFWNDVDTCKLLLQELQEFQPADRGEADAVDAHRGAAVRDHQVGPYFHLR